MYKYQVYVIKTLLEVTVHLLEEEETNYIGH